MALNKIVRDCLEICNLLDVDLATIKGPCREEEITLARSVIYYRLREKGYSWQSIANMLGKDHGSCIWGARRLKTMMRYVNKTEGLNNDI